MDGLFEALKCRLTEVGKRMAEGNMFSNDVYFIRR